jgi:hypothetical protein
MLIKEMSSLQNKELPIFLFYKDLFESGLFNRGELNLSPRLVKPSPIVGLEFPSDCE